MKLNFVIDLDQTALYTHEDEDEDGDFDGSVADKFRKLGLYTTREGSKIRDRVYTIKIDNIYGNCVGDKSKLYGVFRPYLKEFLKFLSEHPGIGHIIIWTAGTRKYGDDICKLLFTDIEKRPTIVFTRGALDKDKKPLKKVYEEARKMGIHDITEENTLVLDDKRYTFVDNKTNGICIPIFKCDLTKECIRDHDDDYLLRLMLWLQTKEVKETSDVRRINKKKIFSLSVEEYEMILEEDKESTSSSASDD